MRVLTVRNVHQALPEGIDLVSRLGVRSQSRAGEVLAMSHPVMTIYQKPSERVLFWPERDANPFFHFFESLWMLAGRNDVEWLAYFNSRMATYSDDGAIFHGAYGYRWRRHFGFDQLREIIALLKASPKSRRAVLQIWDAESDLNRDESKYKDIPCNDLVFFDTTGRKLNMTVCCRSNDLVWGAYGANAVHFSMLQEFTASHLGLPVGLYYQLSNNFHAYTRVLEPLLELKWQARDPFRRGSKDPYSADEVSPLQMIQDPETWTEELSLFLTDPYLPFTEPFFRRVAYPMWAAFRLWKHDKNFDAAYEAMRACQAADWRRAGIEWLQRREEKASVRT